MVCPARPSGSTSAKACCPRRHEEPTGTASTRHRPSPGWAFIRTAQAAGLTLVEIASIVDLRDDGPVPCRHVTTLLENKLADVRTRRRELAEVEAELGHLIERGHDLDPAECTDTDICHILAAPRPQEPTRHTGVPATTPS